MQRLERRAIGPRRALAPALAGGLSVPLSVMVFGAFLDPRWGTVAFWAVFAFAVIFGATVVGGRRGLALVWMLIPALWILLLRVALHEGRWSLVGTVRLLPDAFTSWSLMALPVALAGAVFVYADRRPGGRWHTDPWVLALWIGLLGPSAWLAMHAPDVGQNPRDHPLVLILTGVLLFPAPFLLSWWFVRRLRSVDSIPDPYSGRSP